MVLPDLPFLIPFNKPSSTFACESPQVLLGFPPDTSLAEPSQTLAQGGLPLNLTHGLLFLASHSFKGKCSGNSGLRHDAHLGPANICPSSGLLETLSTWS